MVYNTEPWLLKIRDFCTHPRISFPWEKRQEQADYDEKAQQGAQHYNQVKVHLQKVADTHELKELYTLKSKTLYMASRKP